MAFVGSDAVELQCDSTKLAFGNRPTTLFTQDPALTRHKSKITKVSLEKASMGVFTQLLSNKAAPRLVLVVRDVEITDRVGDNATSKEVLINPIQVLPVAQHLSSSLQRQPGQVCSKDLYMDLGIVSKSAVLGTLITVVLNVSDSPSHTAAIVAPAKEPTLRRPPAKEAPE